MIMHLAATATTTSSSTATNAVSSYARLPILQTPILGSRPLPTRVSNYDDTTIQVLLADAALPPIAPAFGAFRKNLLNVDKASIKAGAHMRDACESAEDIVTTLVTARQALNVALQAFAPGFPECLDVSLEGDQAQLSVRHLIEAIKVYDKELRRAESVHARHWNAQSACATSLGLLFAVGGSAISFCAPPMRPTPEEADLLNPGIRISAALLCFVPLVSTSLHFALRRTQPISDLRKALHALRDELKSELRKELKAHVSATPVAEIAIACDRVPDGIAAQAGRAARAGYVAQRHSI